MDAVAEYVAVGSSGGETPPGERASGAHAALSDDRPYGWGSPVVELSLLLPKRHLDALEKVAAGRGITTGQLLRRLVGECVARPPECRG